jgi:thioredoxin reductase (NADPH)
MIADKHAPIVIIGSGPAGYAAAIYAARAMRKPLIIEGLQPGGQLTITTDVENYPGYAEVVQGPWMMDQMRAQATHVGAEIVADTIMSADLSRRPFLLAGDSGRTYGADALIIATGAKARWLGLESEKRLAGGGVSACATCDGFFYRGKEVVVVGGGNTAVEEALFLTNFATKVTLIHRRDQLRAEKILQERLFAHPKIQVVWNSAVEEILGDGAPPVVVGVRVRDLQTGAERTLACDGFFVAIGHEPQTSLFAGQLAMKPGGYLIVEPGTAKTDIPGVFAAGDVADDTYRQAVTAAGMGCMAALDAERFLSGLEHASHAAAE